MNLVLAIGWVAWTAKRIGLRFAIYWRGLDSVALLAKVETADGFSHPRNASPPEGVRLYVWQAFVLLAAGAAAVSVSDVRSRLCDNCVLR